MVAGKKGLIENGLIRAEEVMLECFLKTISVDQWLTNMENLTVELNVGVISIDTSFTTKMKNCKCYNRYKVINQYFCRKENRVFILNI